MPRNVHTGNYMENTKPLAHSGLTFDEIRSKASGLHFAKEMLSPKERQMLSMLEDLIELVDGPPF